MEPDLADFPSDVTGVYGIILKRLWPMELVESDELRKLTNQSEYARRTRELRNEWGYPIESTSYRVQVKDIGEDGKPVTKTKTKYRYRLTGHERAFPKRRRPYFNKGHKTQILKRCGAECQICKLKVDSNDIDEVSEYLMWDHKVPFDQLGETNADNGQPLCKNCNNLKKQACGTCPRLDCHDCLWAYPEKASNIVVLVMDNDAISRAKESARKDGISMSEAVSKLIKTYLSESPVEKGEWKFY